MSVIGGSQSLNLFAAEYSALMMNIGFSSKESILKSNDEFDLLLDSPNLCPHQTIHPLLRFTMENIKIEQYAKAKEYLDKALKLIEHYGPQHFHASEYYYMMAVIELKLMKNIEPNFDELVNHKRNYEKSLRRASMLGHLRAKRYLMTYLMSEDAPRYAERQPLWQNNPGRFMTEAFEIAKELLEHTPEELGITDSCYTDLKTWVEKTETRTKQVHEHIDLLFLATEKILNSDKVPKADKDMLLPAIEMTAMMASLISM